MLSVIDQSMKISYVNHDKNKNKKCNGKTVDERSFNTEKTLFLGRGELGRREGFFRPTKGDVHNTWIPNCAPIPKSAHA